jgi:aminopeptidase N
MGINETKYGWMDEGWATVGEWLISKMIDSSLEDDYGMDRYMNAAGREVDLPITTLTTQEYGPSMFINSYPKPALGYLYVKDMLGDELFFKGLHNYFRNWNSRHPMPYDFFYSMNEGTGKNLNWFWKRWFFDNGVPDLAIAKFTESGNQKKIIIESKGTKPLPVDITVEYRDGSAEKFHRTVEVWEKGNKTIAIEFSSKKQVKIITLGSIYIPDVDKSNNIYLVKKKGFTILKNKENSIIR